MEVSRRAVATGTIAAAVLPHVTGQADALTITPTLGYPTRLATLPPGTYSHWLQPWRTMIATRPASAFTGGVGLQEPDFTTTDATFAMMAASGIRHLRMGLQWGMFSVASPMSLAGANATRIASFVRRAVSHGMRPLVLLDAHDGAPCPFTSTVATLAADYAPGDGAMRLAATDGLVAGHSGPTAFWPPGDLFPVANYLSAAGTMAPVLFTGFAGGIATLSKPLAVAIPSGAQVVVNTLAYRPFGAPGDADTEATMTGWLAYVDAVAAFMNATLAPVGAAGHFDLEVWNELTFGCAFLDINNYYAQPIAPVSTAAVPPIVTALVARTAAHVASRPAAFMGVRITDGTANTMPWPAASTEPAAVTALSKHWYPNVQHFPADDRGWGLDAAGNLTAFQPNYVNYTTELAATAVPVFTIARDIADETTSFGPATHGRLSRTTPTGVRPVPVWITETGIATSAVGVTDPKAAAHLAAKGTLRSVFFHIGIGVERVYLFQGRGDVGQFALIDAGLPAVPTLALASLARALGHIATFQSSGGPGTLRTHGISARMVDTPRTLFKGNGTAAVPDMTEPADLVVLPIQVSPSRTVFAVWFIGTDMRVDLAPSRVDITITGTDGEGASLAGYDPLTGKAVPVSRVGGSATALTLRVAVTDVPLLLTLASA